jgi:hypothetical protein
MALMELRKAGKRKIYGWFLAVAGALLICWVIYRIVGEFTYFNVSEPLRSALISGEAARVYPTSTLILLPLGYLFEVAIGAAVLYSGFKRIRKPASNI